jgi:hypothetical protein
VVGPGCRPWNYHPVQLASYKSSVLLGAKALVDDPGSREMHKGFLHAITHKNLCYLVP